MKNQKGFAPIIGLIVVVIVLGASLYVYKNQQNQDINKETTTTPQDINKETTTTRLEGVFSYLNGNFTFLVFVNDNQDTHVIQITFSNQDEAIKKLDIDISKLDISKLPADLPTVEWCSIMGESVATIDVTGYDTERAEKDWKDEVTLKTVVVPAVSSVFCATP